MPHRTQKLDRRRWARRSANKRAARFSGHRRYNNSSHSLSSRSFNFQRAPRRKRHPLYRRLRCRSCHPNMCRESSVRFVLSLPRGEQAVSPAELHVFMAKKAQGGLLTNGKNLTGCRSRNGSRSWHARTFVPSMSLPWMIMTMAGTAFENVGSNASFRFERHWFWFQRPRTAANPGVPGV